MNKDSLSSESEDFEDREPRKKPGTRSESTKHSRSKPSTSDSSSSGVSHPTKMATFDLAEKKKDRGGHLRQASDGEARVVRGKERREEDSSAISMTRDSVVWTGTVSMKSKTDDSIPSVKSEQPESRHLKLALPTRRSTRGTLFYHPADEDLASIDALSDSTTSQQTIPEVPATARNRSGSLSSFTKTLSKFVAVLDDNPSSGASPPISLRDTGSVSSRSLTSITSNKPGPSKTSSSPPGAHSDPSTTPSPPTAKPSLEKSANKTVAPEESIENTIIHNRTVALEWLVASVANDQLMTITLNQVIRNRDLCESRRPYERLVQTVVTTPSAQMAAHGLDLVTVLLPEQTLAHQCEFFDMLSNSAIATTLTRLRRSEEVMHRLVLGTFERLYVDLLALLTQINWDPRDPRLSSQMALLMRQCEPIHSFPPVVWENCSRIAFLAVCYLGNQYPHVIRKILDENEAQTSDTYCLPLLVSMIAQFIIDSIVAHATAEHYEPTKPTGPETQSSTSSSSKSRARKHSPQTSLTEAARKDSIDTSTESPVDEESSDSRSSPVAIRIHSSPKATIETPIEASKPINSNNLLLLLFSQDSGFYELFCIALILFDIAWKETDATPDRLEAALEKTRRLFSISCATTNTISSLKDHLSLTSKLSPPKQGSPLAPRRQTMTQNANSSAAAPSGGAFGFMGSPPVPSHASPSHSTPVKPTSDRVVVEDPKLWIQPLGPMSISEMRWYFVELMKWVTTPVDKASMVLLADGVGAMRVLASLPGFPWDAATEQFLYHLLRNIGGKDGLWLRTPQLSSQLALWIDHQLNTDPRGPDKLVEALEMIAVDHSEAYSYTKPLVRMLRSTRQLSIPLRIINRLFDFKQGELERKAYLNDLARCQALSIMKSKVWSTFSEVKHELLVFQSNLLSLQQMKFDSSVREHEQLLADCWHAAFPRLRLKHVGPIQWALLGFRKATSVHSFRGTPMVGMQHLLHFITAQSAQAQHLMLCNHATVPPLGDCAVALSAILMRLMTSREYLMPMIFDEDRDGFAEVHAVSLLWMTQMWLMDPSLTTDALLNKTESHIVYNMKSLKATTTTEFSQQIGVSDDLISGGWAKLVERVPNAAHSTGSVLNSARSAGLPNSVSSANLNYNSAAGNAPSPSPLTTSAGGLASGSGSANGVVGSYSAHLGALGASSPVLRHHTQSSRHLALESSHDSVSGSKSRKTQLSESTDSYVVYGGSGSASDVYHPHNSSNGFGGFGSTLPSALSGFAAEPDFLEEYLDNHRSELMQRENQLANFIESQAMNAKKGRQRGSSRAERELAESERLSRTIAANRISLALEPVLTASDDDKHIKEIIKLRKAEAKEQKESKATLAKQKPFRT